MSDHRLEIVLAAKDITGTAFTKVTGRVKALVSGVTSLQGGLLGLAGVGGFGAVAGGALSTARAFERYQVQLKTLTGSQEAAKASMDWITEFTRTTPYELDEVTAAFAKLTAYGLDAPAWMRSLGDTASSMGKSMNDAVEMFADAVTGEFERLKEFGVRAKQQGDQVTFSWSQNGKDMVLTADKTQSGISKALGKIFERFKGGMEEQSRTFDGLWSNMMDTYTGLERRVMDAGVFDAIKDGISDINQEMSTWIENNGELIAQRVPEYIDSIKDSVGGLYDFYKGLPDEVVGAAGYGIIGRILLGKGAGAITAALKLSYDAYDQILKKINDAIGDEPWPGLLPGIKDMFNEQSKLERQIKAARKRAQQNLDDLNGWRGKLFPDTYRQQYEKEMATVDRLTQKLNKLNIARGFAGLSGYADNDAIEAAFNNRRPVPPPGNAGAAKVTGGDKAPMDILTFDGAWDLDGGAYVEDAINKYNREVQNAIELQNRMAEKIDDTYGDYGSIMDGLADDTKEAFDFMGQLSERTCWAMQENFSDFFYSLKDGISDLGDLWESLTDSIWRAWSDMMGQMATQAVFGKDGQEGLASKIGNWLVDQFHDGGVVGQTSTSSRSVSPGLFVGAPRLHNGLAPDEFPAILQRGETVIPKNKIVAGAAPSITVNMINQSGQQIEAQADQPQFDGESWVINVIMTHARTNKNGFGTFLQNVGAA